MWIGGIAMKHHHGHDNNIIVDSQGWPRGEILAFRHFDVPFGYCDDNIPNRILR